MPEIELIDSALDDQENGFSKQGTKFILFLLICITASSLIANEFATWFKDDIIGPEYFNRAFRIQIRLYILIYCPIFNDMSQLTSG